MTAWWIISIALLIIGFGLAVWAYNTQATEEYDSLLWFVVGVIVFIMGILSSIIKWLFFS